MVDPILVLLRVGTCRGLDTCEPLLSSLVAS